MDSRGKMLVEMSVSDMGSISIALDHFVAMHGREAEMDPKSWADLRDKWDVMYMSVHKSLDLGVRSLEGR